MALAQEQDYWFDTEEGPRTLAELFGVHTRLLVPHFPFDADWRAALPACERFADRCEDAFEALDERGVALVAVSAAPIDAIVAYKWRMGWSFAWVSSLATGFDAAAGLGLGRRDGRFERPGLSAYALRESRVERTRRGGDPSHR